MTMSYIRMIDVLTSSTSNWRYNALMKRCKEKFGEIGPEGVPEGGQVGDAAAAAPATPNGKRKRGKAGKKGEEFSAKKVKSENDDGEAAEDDVEAGEKKTAKTAAPVGEEDGEVKSEPEA